MKFKSARVELKASHDGRTISGYASTFGPPPDVVGDVVDPGAFAKTIQENGPPKTRVKLLWLHRDPLGLPTLLREDSKGLFFEALVSKTRLGDEALELVRDKVVDRMSIGYATIKESKNPETGANHLKEVRLFEISPVAFAANERAEILGVKDGGLGIESIVKSVVATLGLVRDPATGLVLPPAKKSTVAFQDFPLLDRAREWDSTAAEERVRAWAEAADGPNPKYRRAFIWYDPENEDVFSGYKLQIADVVNGELMAVPRAIFAVAGALQGSRGGVDLPPGDVAAVRSHVARYYDKMSREFDDPSIVPPWESRRRASSTPAPRSEATESAETVEAAPTVTEVAERLVEAGDTLKQVLNDAASSLKSLVDATPEPTSVTQGNESKGEPTDEGETEAKKKEAADAASAKALDEFGRNLDKLTHKLKGEK